MENEDMKKFALALVEEFEEHPPLKNHLMPSQMISLWRYFRVYTQEQLMGGMTLLSILKDTDDPMGNFTEAIMDLWLTAWHESGRGAAYNETEQTGAMH